MGSCIGANFATLPGVRKFKCFKNQLWPLRFRNDRYADGGVHASDGWLIPSRAGGDIQASEILYVCSYVFETHNTNPLSARTFKHPNLMPSLLYPTGT